MQIYLGRAILFAGFLTLSSSAPAQLPTLGDIGRVLTAPVTVPTEVIVNTVRGGDPAAPIRDSVRAGGNVVTGTTNSLEAVHNLISSAPREAIDRNLGGDWSRAFDALTGGERITREMALTSGRFLGGCLRGLPCNVNQIVAMPVAASLRDAYKAYIRFGQPMPPQTIQLLSRVVPMNILVGARVAFGATPDMTFPGFINSYHSVQGGAHAVTIGNLIIFSRPLNDGDWVWLLHELHHIEQYASRSPDVMESIDGFATDYVQYSGNMETEAQNVALQRFGQLQASCQYGGC